MCVSVALLHGSCGGLGIHMPVVRVWSKVDVCVCVCVCVL